MGTEADRPNGTMRAIRLLEATGVKGLTRATIEVPHPGASEVLVEVHAAAITRDELDWPVDRLPATPSYEFSGVVVDSGEDVTEVSVGDDVFALVGFDRDGAAAEFVAVPASFVAHKPASLDHVHTAAVPLAALTAWQGLFSHGRLSTGERVVVTGPTGGVGHLAVQLAHSRGAHVIAVAPTSKAEAARALGANEVVAGSDLRSGSETEPVDLVFDTAGGEVLEAAAALLRSGGRLISIAAEPPESRSDIRALYFVVEPNRAQLEEIAAAIDRGELGPAIDSIFPLDDAPAAFARSMERATRGKVVLRVARWLAS